MESKRILISEALGFGFRGVLRHIRLFFFVLLEAVLLLGTVVALVGLFNQELAVSIITSVKDATYYQGSISALDVAAENSLVTFISVLILSMIFVGFVFAIGDFLFRLVIGLMALSLINYGLRLRHLPPLQLLIPLFFSNWFR